MNLVSEIPRPRPRRPIPTPRKSIKDMVKEYEENIILPPPEFRDGYKPVPLPRTKKQTLEIPRPRPRNGFEIYMEERSHEEFLKIKKFLEEGQGKNLNFEKDFPFEK